MAFYQAKSATTAPAAPLASPVSKWRRRLISALRLGSGLTLLAAIVQLVLIRTTGDWWWFGTVLLFAPRWTLLGPVAVLALISAILDWRSLRINLLSGVVVAWPLMGWQAPWPWPWPGDELRDHSLRVMSINAGGGASLALLREEIKRVSPDIVAIPESPTDLAGHLFGPEWKVISDRGLTLASRFPIDDVDVFDSSRVGRWVNLGIRALIKTPAGNAWVASIYLESPRDGFESLMLTRAGLYGVNEIGENTKRRSLQSAAISKWLEEVDGPLIVMGDFNLPPESLLLRRDWLKYQDAFLAAGSGYGFTWFSNWHGVRIDHVFASRDWRVETAVVAGPMGGDHRPVIVELSR